MTAADIIGFGIAVCVPQFVGNAYNCWANSRVQVNARDKVAAALWIDAMWRNIVVSAGLLAIAGAVAHFGNGGGL